MGIIVFSEHESVKKEMQHLTCNWVTRACSWSQGGAHWRVSGRQALNHMAWSLCLRCIHCWFILLAGCEMASSIIRLTASGDVYSCWVSGTLREQWWELVYALLWPTNPWWEVGGMERGGGVTVNNCVNDLGGPGLLRWAGQWWKKRTTYQSFHHICLTWRLE